MKAWSLTLQALGDRTHGSDTMEAGRMDHRMQPTV